MVDPKLFTLIYVYKISRGIPPTRSELKEYLGYSENKLAAKIHSHPRLIYTIPVEGRMKNKKRVDLTYDGELKALYYIDHAEHYQILDYLYFMVHKLSLPPLHTIRKRVDIQLRSRKEIAEAQNSKWRGF